MKKRCSVVQFTSSFGVFQYFATVVVVVVVVSSFHLFKTKSVSLPYISFEVECQTSLIRNFEKNRYSFKIFGGFTLFLCLVTGLLSIFVSASTGGANQTDDRVGRLNNRRVYARNMNAILLYSRPKVGRQKSMNAYPTFLSVDTKSL